MRGQRRKQCASIEKRLRDNGLHPAQEQEINNGMKILVVAARLCYPLDGGAKIRAYNLLRELAKHHDVTMLTYFGDKAEQKYFPHFEDIGVTLVPIYLPVIDGGVSATAILRVLLSGLPLNVAKYYSREMVKSIAEHLEGGADCVHCEHLHMFSMIPQTGCPVVLDAHNVESQIAHRYAAAERNPLKKAVLRLNGSLMRRYEVAAVKSSRLVLAVSEEDRRTFSSMGSAGNVRVVENGVDVDFFVPQTVASDGSLVFVGSMDWRPNDEGIIWFLDEIWPLIKKKDSALTFVVVGKNPSAALVNRGVSLPGVTITGAVEDVRPYVGRAAVCIVPLRIGGGTRLKILEAFAMGKAVVSTSLGCEGIQCKDGENILIADGPESFAASVRRLLDDRLLNSSLGANARKLVEASYSWDTIRRKFLSALESI